MESSVEPGFAFESVAPGFAFASVAEGVPDFVVGVADPAVAAAAIEAAASVVGEAAGCVVGVGVLPGVPDSVGGDDIY
jgi:hypothetical protein